ncbi:MAG: HAD family hydrolase [archaeon]
MKTRAVIFDLDSTILRLDVDWRKVIIEVEKFFPDKCPDIDDLKSSLAYFVEANLNYKKLPLKKRKRFLKMLERMEIEGAEKSGILPFSRCAIGSLSRNYKLGVVSGNSVYAVRVSLKKFGLLKRFGAVIGRENSAKVKPAPDGIILALKKLRVKPCEAVFVGDNIYDVIAAKAAGTKAIAVLSGNTKRKALAAANPDRIIKNLGSLEGVLKEIFQ